MMNILEGIDNTMKEQYLKQNESLKRIQNLQKIEDKEQLIIERLERMEERQHQLLVQLA